VSIVDRAVNTIMISATEEFPVGASTTPGFR
jgi:hypothetical protein